MRLVLVVALYVAMVAPAAAAPPGWAPTGSMTAARDQHTATLLADGRVLVAGGDTASGPTASAEVYTPATGTWAGTGSMVAPRVQHTATLLTNGKVLVAGGRSVIDGAALTSAELYDPALGTWSAVQNMEGARRLHTATRLPNGAVLIAGGSSTAGTTPSNGAELFNPVTNTFTATAPLVIARYLHTATALANGDVLVTGGYIPIIGTAVAIARVTEVYSAGTWTPSLQLDRARATHSATALIDGRVLISGGGDGTTHLATAELLNSTLTSQSPTPVMARGHNEHTATRLPDGKVLIASGLTVPGNQPGPLAELFDPGTSTWAPAGTLATARRMHTATLLGDGRVLVAAGATNVSATRQGTQRTATAEIYTPATSLTADPALLFDDRTVGDASTGSAQITNTGAVPLLVSQVAIGGAFPGDYTVTQNGCANRAIAPSASCAIHLRFAPGAAGARGATLTFTANTAATNHAISLIGRGTAVQQQQQPPPAPPAVTTPRTIIVTLAYQFSVKGALTRLTGLTVKGVPRGAAITVKCPKGCAKKTLTKRNARGTVKLAGVVTKRLKAGTKITVTVSRPGEIAAVKILTIRKGKRPSLATRCLAPGAKTPRTCGAR